MTKEFNHTTVLLHETVDMLDIKPNGIYVDVTLGGAGHSEYLLSQLTDAGHLYALIRIRLLLIMPIFAWHPTLKRDK